MAAPPEIARRHPVTVVWPDHHRSGVRPYIPEPREDATVSVPTQTVVDALIAEYDNAHIATGVDEVVNQVTYDTVSSPVTAPAEAPVLEESRLESPRRPGWHGLSFRFGFRRRN